MNELTHPIVLAMIATAIVGMVGSLFRGRFALAIVVSFALFGLSLVFPVPEAPPAVGRRLHWFPFTLLLFILTLIGVSVTTVIGYLARLLIRTARA